MTHHTSTRRRNYCTCGLCKSPATVHGTTDQHTNGCDCTYCTRAAETGRRLKNYIIRTETQSAPTTPAATKLPCRTSAAH